MVEMYPTDNKGENGLTSTWQSSYISIDDSGPFSACPFWFGLDRSTYGIYGLDEFMFYLDQGGEATAIELKALKLVLERR
jgi:hypothetical protein